MNHIEYLKKWFEEHYENGFLKDKYYWDGWRLEKRCLFNSGYEECSGFKFYEKYPKYNEMFIGSTI